MAGAEIDAWAQRILRPLRFAARDGFKSLSVVTDLEGSLLRGLAAAPSDVRALLSTDELMPQIEGLDAASDSEKRRRIETLIARLEGLKEVGASEPDDKPFKAPPSKDTSAKDPAASSRRGGRSTAKAGRGRMAPSAVQLDTPLIQVVGVGPKTAERLAARGLETVEDVLYFLPNRYEDRSAYVSIRDLTPGRRATIRGTVQTAAIRHAGRGKRIFELAVTDGTGTLSCRFFRFHRGPMESRYSKGTAVIVSGPVSSWGAMKQMVHPELTLDEGAPPEGIIPVYPDVEGVPTKKLRKLVPELVEAALPKIEDPLPETLRARCGLPLLPNVLRAAHRPEPGAFDDEAVRRRLAFDELFFLQLALGAQRQTHDAEPGVSHDVDKAWRDLADAILPFTLTAAQSRVLEDIIEDMRGPHPMNRLLQGDVGSGKTAVAFVAVLWAVTAGRQAVLLAPTEILAEQHFARAEAILAPAGLRVALLTGSTSTKARAALFRALARGDVGLLVGTHAVLEPPVVFRDLGLAIIDEQHRFGVQQRAHLRAKRTDSVPDVLVMTATPIPRTLALTAYGDLRVSVIDELPPGRQPGQTQIFTPDRREQVWTIVQEELERGRQAFIVYPLIESSEKLDLQAATEEVETLRTRFGAEKVDLLHGRMTSDEKATVMGRFSRGETAVLVSTTVIEVGVDVPNATVMVVENADRFGLSQLHQLRGRVGRGAHRGRCLLVIKSAAPESLDKLSILEETSDGFRVAERDLELRGPGEVLGTRQSGLSDLAWANLARDGRIVEETRREAERLLGVDPALTRHPLIAHVLRLRMGDRLTWAQVG